MSETPEREAMEYDVVIVGAGPAGLAAAIHLKQLAAERGQRPHHQVRIVGRRGARRRGLCLPNVG